MMTKRERNRQLEFRRQAEEATRTLRTGTSPMMCRLRDVLAEKGVDPLRTALIGIQVDDLHAHAGGTLVLPSGDAVGFGFEWDGKTVDQAELSQWFVDNDDPCRAIGQELLEREQS